jgi:uncharacterized protein (DUF488 family)
MNELAKREAGSLTVWTIGHSTRSIEKFLEVLSRHGIEAVIDVRRSPMARRNPQYSGAALREALEANEIEYQWLPSLGGRRTPSPDSRNTRWRNPAFRGYADHMETQEFADGLTTLLDTATRLRSAVLCAEAVWWRCHRALLADALSALNVAVMHILDESKAVAHPFTAAARIVDGELTYAPDDSDAGDLPLFEEEEEA